MNVYKHNIRYGDERWSSLVGRLANIPAQSAVFTPETAKDGLPTIAINHANGSRSFLHSAYHPQREADALIEQRYNPATTVFIISGFGLGYHALSLQKTLKPAQRMLIVEPVMELFAYALTQCDFECLFRDERVHFVVAAHDARRNQCIKTYCETLVPYRAETIPTTSISFYDRWDEYRPFVSDTQRVVAESLDTIRTMRARSAEACHVLRTEGLSKRFLGEYKECLAFFRARIKAGEPFGYKEIGLLATYFLLSHYSYAETFEKGGIE